MTMLTIAINNQGQNKISNMKGKQTWIILKERKGIEV